MNIQSLPFRTGAGKVWGDGNLLLATWRWAAATEIQWDSHTLTELRCHQEFGDLGHFAVKDLLQLSQERAASVSPVREPSACKRHWVPHYHCLVPSPAQAQVHTLPLASYSLSFHNPGCPTDPECGWEPVRFTGLRPTTRNLNREDFILARNLGFARSEYREHQFSSLPIKFPMPAPHSLEEINEKEGLGEMNFATSHISIWKQGKVSKVYFISTAQEVSVPKIALIPASTLCYFWHLCKLI